MAGPLHNCELDVIPSTQAAAPPTKVLIVDDSAVVRKLLGDALRREPDIAVVGGAPDPFVARDLILQHEPDVVTLDIEMPRMDGLTFLRRLMAHRPVPVIVLSSLTQRGSATTIDALRAGAIDAIPKPDGPYSIPEVTGRLIQRIRAIRQSPPMRLRRAIGASHGAGKAVPMPAAARRLGRTIDGVLALGASTGGTQAIEALLTRLPIDGPPIVAVQHMPAGFTRAFANRLNGVCGMRVLEAAGGERLERGTVYVAPGDRHLTVERQGLHLVTRLTMGEPVHHQRPSVDVLYESLAGVRGVPIVAALLTGMGADGADGMVALRRQGAETIAEDERSCVVFGMPREAIARGGACHVATLFEMPTRIIDCFDRLSTRRAN